MSAPAESNGPVFVTGGGGFVGTHLLAALRAAGLEPIAPRSRELDLLDGEAVQRFLAALRPARVFHLAALASVARSWDSPAETMRANLEMTLNVLEAARVSSPEAAILIAGSGEVYGPPESLPVGEEAPFRPQNPYAVSKAACDLLAGQYADAHGLGIVRTRAFNHCGPGQSDTYVVGTLTRAVAEAESAGRREAELKVGALDVARDFTDVRDVVAAYRAAIASPPGVYNVCSGRSLTIRALIDTLRRCTDVELDVAVDAARLRPADPSDIRGSAARLQAATGWAPAIPLERTLRDAIDAWRSRA